MLASLIFFENFSNLCYALFLNKTILAISITTNIVTATTNPRIHRFHISANDTTDKNVHSHGKINGAATRSAHQAIHTSNRLFTNGFDFHTGSVRVLIENT